MVGRVRWREQRAPVSCQKDDLIRRRTRWAPSRTHKHQPDPTGDAAADAVAYTLSDFSGEISRGLEVASPAHATTGTRGCPMSKYLLIITVFFIDPRTGLGLHPASVTLHDFPDRYSCQEAGKMVAAGRDENDLRWVCLGVLHNAQQQNP